MSQAHENKGHTDQKGTSTTNWALKRKQKIYMHRKIYKNKTAEIYKAKKKRQHLVPWQGAFIFFNPTDLPLVKTLFVISERTLSQGKRLRKAPAVVL